MQQFIGIILAVLAAIVTAEMIVKARRGKIDLFSVRNFFLLGFVVFQLTSGTITMFTGYYDALSCSDWGKTGAVYLFVVLLFLPIFYVTYNKGWVAKSLASRLRSHYGASTPGTMMLLAFLFLASAVFTRLVLTQVPVLGVLALVVATGLAAAAAAMAMWVWAPRLLNVPIAVCAVIVIMGALGVVLYQAFGRRDALSVLIATIWGAHHGYWKHIGYRRAARQIVPLGAGALIFMAAFSAGRKEGAEKLDLAGSISRLGQGELGRGILEMASGQAAAACSMWLIETRPEGFKYDTLHTLRYFVGHPIPRLIWDTKPMALGWEMTSQGRVRGKSKGFNFGPGLIGHIWNDNPWVSLVPYAMLLAMMMRFMDHLIRLNPANPFIIVPLGVALGDVLGLARGETGLFLSRAVIMMVSSFVGMAICAALLGFLGLRSPAMAQASPDQPVPDHEHPHDHHHADEYGADYGADYAATYTDEHRAA